jgi:hypothetical protein
MTSAANWGPEGLGEFDFSLLQPVDAADVDEMVTPDDVPTEPEAFDSPDASFVKPPPRKRNAAAYEKKIKGLFQVPLRYAVTHEATVPDAAAILMYGPGIASAWGNAAAHDERIARAVDFLTTGTENPLAAAVLSTAPLFLQMVRNHEPQLEPTTRGIRVPFTRGKRVLKLRIGIKLNRLRPLTNDPEKFADHVFNAPDVRDMLTKQGVGVAGYFRV